MSKRLKTYVSLSDQALLERLSNGDGGAYQELWARHIDAALRVARRVAPGHAEDIASEAFLTVYSQVTNGTSTVSSFRAYLFTVMRNIAAKLHQENSRYVNDPEMFLEELSALEDASSSVEVVEESRTLLASFLALPERWQRVLWLTEIEGRKRSDIATEFGLQPNAVSVLTRRARAGLREEWLRQQVPPTLTGDEGHIGALIPSLVIGEITSSERDRVQEHLGQCAPCRRAYGNVHAAYRSRRKGALLITSGFGALGVVLAPATTPLGVVSVASALGIGALAAGAAAVVGGILGVGIIIAPSTPDPAETAPQAASVPYDPPVPAGLFSQPSPIAVAAPSPASPPVNAAGPDASQVPPAPVADPSATALPDVALVLSPEPPGQVPDYPLPLPTPPTPADPSTVPPPTGGEPGNVPSNAGPKVALSFPSSSYIAPVLSGSASEGSQVAVQVDDDLYLTAVNADSTWTYDLRSLGLPAGEHRASVWIVAPDSSTSTSSVTSFVIDDLGLVGLEDGTLVDLGTEEGDQGLVFTLTGSPLSTVCIASDVGQSATISLDENGSATKRIRFLTSGVYGLHLAACDSSYFGPEQIRTVWASRGIFDPWGDEPLFEVIEP